MGMFTLAQTIPAYAGPTQIDSSARWVYVRTPSLPTYIMGPWYNTAAHALFINVPRNQGFIFRIPLTTTTADRRLDNPRPQGPRLARVGAELDGFTG